LVIKGLAVSDELIIVRPPSLDQQARSSDRDTNHVRQILLPPHRPPQDLLAERRRSLLGAGIDAAGDPVWLARQHNGQPGQVIVVTVVVWQIGWLLWMVASLGLVPLLLAWTGVVQPRRWALVAVSLWFAGAAIDWVDEIVEWGVVPWLADRAARYQTAFFPLQLREHAYRVVLLAVPNA
jgi:hypothetical protein